MGSYWMKDNDVCFIVSRLNDIDKWMIIEGDIKRWTYERFSVAREDLECRESE
jgi:hypothetical protein